MALEPQEKNENDNTKQENGNQKKKLAVRLLTFIPGNTLYSVRPWTATHFYQCGILLAKFMEELKVKKCLWLN